MRGRAGFTLAEVTVAIVAAALCIQLAHAVSTVVHEGLARNAEVAERLATERNARRWVRDALLHAQTAGEAGQPFVGTSDDLAFDAWVLADYGGPARARVRIALAGGDLVADQSPGSRLVIQSGVEALAIDYLLGWGEREAWVSGWSSAAALPHAVRLRIALNRETDVSDTLLLRTGRHR